MLARNLHQSRCAFYCSEIFAKSNATGKYHTKGVDCGEKIKFRIFVFLLARSMTRLAGAARLFFSRTDIAAGYMNPFMESLLARKNCVFLDWFTAHWR